MDDQRFNRGPLSSRRTAFGPANCTSIACASALVAVAG
ncbi:hypothetical protein MYVA_5127 [Mycolicibacterium vaccae 95051]|nr:hypothetical protein MYVA_5127 [Mycolicibacterium vaccae 95051]